MDFPSSGLAIAYAVEGADLLLQVDRRGKPLIRCKLINAAGDVPAIATIDFSTYAPDFVFYVGDPDVLHRTHDSLGLDAPEPFALAAPVLLVQEATETRCVHVVPETDLEISHNMEVGHLMLRVEKGGIKIFRCVLDRATARPDELLADAPAYFSFRIGDKTQGFRRLLRAGQIRWPLDADGDTIGNG